LGSFAVLIVYILGLSLFKSKPIALLAAFFSAVSFINIHQSTWLSNPQLLVISIGIYYVSLWKIFFEKSTWFHFVLAGISLGISIQGGFFEIFLITSFLTLYIRQVFLVKKLWLFSFKNISLFSASFLATISSMILTQVLMIQRHVLTIEKLQAVKRDTIPASIVLENIFHLYTKLFQDSLVPTGVVLLFLLFLIPLVIGWKHIDAKAKTLLLIVATGPLWLLLVQFRNSDHILFGVDSVVYLLLAVGLFYIKKNITYGKFIFFLTVGTFIVVNMLAVNQWKARNIHYYGIQRGALLSEQLSLIDKTYELAEGRDFSISASTNPYGINVTWGYLYDWYGKSEYGYVPSYYGASQIGHYGENLLPETGMPTPVHFTIMEPDTGLPDRIMQAFLADQDSKSATPSGELGYGTLRLQLRSKSL
ncbi:MAG: hypothetical protein QG639_304, partial [Patescibacteria group bacterium]|nr:hypothetical protein [Patescibacteria group bacterium]